MLPSNFKPMLASPVVLEKIKYPVICSPKLDGIRCMIFGGVAYSRNLKPIPNLHVQKFVAENATYLEAHDGELLVGDIADPDVFRKTTSGIMTVSGEPDFVFKAFDVISDLPYRERVLNVNPDYALEYETAYYEHELLALEESYLSRGFEGLMLRSLDGPYKYGRSSVNEGYVLKLKRFKDDEAVIIGFKEEMKNNNEATVDNLGRTERSSHKANKSPKGTLGTVLVRNNEGLEFEVGSGFKANERKEIWENQDQYLGKKITYRYFQIGMKDLPRFPTFKGFRSENDL